MVLIAACGFAVYSNSLKGQFLWDDEHLVKYNPYIKDWSYLPKILVSSIRTGAEEVSNFYRPVQVFTYLLDYSLWKLNVIGYHLTNVLLHILVALTIYWLIQILFRDRNLSLLTGLFFVVHPIHTEAVSYIAGRADSLVALFIILCLIFYIRNLHENKLTLTILMGLSYVLALLSRENGLILPFLLLLYHFAFKKPVHKKRFALIAGIAVGYLMWRWTLLRDVVPGESYDTTLLQRLPGFFVSIISYIRLLIAPFNLHMAYGGILFGFAYPRAICGILLSVLILVLAYKKREQNRLAFFSVYWFFIVLLPFSNIYPLNAYMAEHWLYLPSIGFFLILAKVLISLSRNKKSMFYATTIAFSLLIFYSCLTLRQNRYWRDPIDFYKQMLRHAPYSSKLYNNLAKAYREIGEKDKVIELLQKAIEIEPENAVAHNNLGNAYKDTGDYKKAVYSYEKAIEVAPDYATPYHNLALMRADIEKNDEAALELLNKAIEINPYYVDAYHKIGLIYINQGKKDEALTFVNKALRIDPDRAEIYETLGYIYIQSGKKDNAIAMYRKAIEVNPNYAKVYHDLSIIYLSDKQYRLAIEHCDRATSLGYKNPALLEALKPHR